MVECVLINFNLDAMCSKRICRDRLVRERDAGESEVHYPGLDVVSRNVANQVQTRKESVLTRLRPLSVLCGTDRNRHSVIVASS
jgi:hypothetical protein